MAMITYSVTVETSTNIDGEPRASGGGSSGPVAWGDITGKPTTFAPSAHNHAWSEITSGKPTTLSGYGITNAYTKTEVDAKIAWTSAGGYTYLNTLSDAVGIGIAAPAATLHVEENTAGNIAVQRIQNRATGDNTSVILELAAGTGNYTHLRQNSGSGTQTIGGAYDTILVNNWTANNNGDLIFGTNAVERMRIQHGGNVCIGNTNDTYKLDVTGDQRITGSHLANYYNVAATSGYGIKFWDGSDDYKIFMANSASSGITELIAGTDYNMYFTMKSGTNRGFVWYNTTTSATAMMHLSAGNLQVAGTVTADNFIQG